MTLKHTILLFTILIALPMVSQDTSSSVSFWNILKSHCGKAYEGSLALPEEDESFGGKKLVMHVRACSENEIKIHVLR